LKRVWLEEYRRCGCSYIVERRSDLVGYCPRHFSCKRLVTKLPVNLEDGECFSEEDLGYAGRG
jgi:hypothetical protein